MLSSDETDEKDLNSTIHQTQTELRWEGRWWTFFQIGLVALVGFLTLQAVETQRILSQLNIEMRYTNARLEKIEHKLDNDNVYSRQDAEREQSLIDKRITVIESRVTSIAEALADIRRRLGPR